jgi:hypothetical protein
MEPTPKYKIGDVVTHRTSNFGLLEIASNRSEFGLYVCKSWGSTLYTPFSEDDLEPLIQPPKTDTSKTEAVEETPGKIRWREFL